MGLEARGSREPCARFALDWESARLERVMALALAWALALALALVTVAPVERAARVGFGRRRRRRRGKDGWEMAVRRWPWRAPEEGSEESWAEVDWKDALATTTVEADWIWEKEARKRVAGDGRLERGTGLGRRKKGGAGGEQERKRMGTMERRYGTRT